MMFIRPMTGGRSYVLKEQPMNRVRHYSPTLLLAVVAAATVLGGPYVMRELAYAEQRGRIEEAQQRLQSGPLHDLNESFRSVARVVEPSVVHLSIKRKPEAED